MALLEHEEEQIVLGMYDRGMLVFPKNGMSLKSSNESGLNSPCYFNMRNVLSISNELIDNGQMSQAEQEEFQNALIKGCADQIMAVTREVEVDHIFGKAQAATAFAAVTARAARISYIWERVDEPSKDTYGSHKRVEGSYKTGERILMADDTTTDGKSKVEGMRMLADVGLVPVAVTLQFDRQEGGVEMLKDEYGLEVNAVTSLSSAVRYLRASNRIDDTTVDALQDYHEKLRAVGRESTYEPPE